MIFKITNKDKYKYFINPFIISFMTAIILIFSYNIYYYNSMYVKLDVFLFLLIIPAIIIFFPLILFFFSYYNTDKNVIFTINEVENKFSYKNGNKIMEFNKEDIEKCTIYLSIPAYHNRTIFAHWLDFFYVKIITSQGSIIITCLTCDSIEDHIPKEKIEKKCSHISHAFPK